MSAQRAISVRLPAELYERIRRAAERSERSVEAVLIESLTVLFGTPPAGLDAALDTYTDEQLWAVVYQRLAWTENERLRDLVAQGKHTLLTPDEQAELESLLDQVDHYTMIRSRALSLLQERGQDVERYLKSGA
jgi:hypothetical protein